jgi:hypothetical protein
MATDEILAWVREQRKQDGRHPNACGRQRTRPNYTSLFLTGVLNSENVTQIPLHEENER